MTEQEIFDKVAAHLLTQGKPSINEYEECMYRAPDGSKCAAGCLVTDEAYEMYGDLMEGEICIGRHASMALSDSGIPEECLVLVRSLQMVHDENKAADWPSRLSQVAEEYRLSPAVLEQFKC